MPSLPRLIIMAMTLGLLTFLGDGLQTEGATVDQKQDRVLRKKQWSNEPIKIYGVKAKGGTILLGEKHSGDDDWFRDLSIDVRNTSNRTIVFIDVAIVFPPTPGTKERVASDHLMYGNYPPLPGETSLYHADQPPLLPGDKATLSLANYDGTREFLNQVGKGQSIKEIEISIEDVVFEDGTKFSGGQIFRRDSNNPRIWLPVNPESASRREQPKLRRNAVFAKISFNSFSARAAPAQDLIPQPTLCYPVLYSEDKFCGENTRCAVRHDHPTNQLVPGRLYKYKSQDDRCVNRDTHVACSTF